MSNRDKIEELYNEKYSITKRLEVLKVDILIAKDMEDAEEWEFLKNERILLRNQLKELEELIEKETKLLETEESEYNNS